jgi:hypothetical protein
LSWSKRVDRLELDVRNRRLKPKPPRRTKSSRIARLRDASSLLLEEPGESDTRR